jgi:hypothetical protein
VPSGTTPNYDATLDVGTVVDTGGSAGSVMVGSVLVADVDVTAKTVTNWRRAGVLPGAATNGWTYTEGATATHNNFLYVGGASFFSPLTASTYTVAYAPINTDGSLGTFAESAPIVGTGFRRLLNIAIATVSGNTFIYALGGTYNDGVTTTNATTRIEYAPINLDGTIGAWSVASTVLPQTTWFHRNAVKGGVIYSSSGNSSGGLQAVNALTPSITGDITLAAFTSNYPDPAAAERWDHGQVIATAGGVDYIYLIAGVGTSTATLDLVNVTPLPLTVSTTWTTTNPLPAARRRMSAAAVDDMIIVPGGATATAMTTGTNTVYIGTVAPGGTVTWTTSPIPMLQARSYGGAAIAPVPPSSVENWNMY